MSYPYTKPQSRYGFRRAWNDPHVGLVGSGPGRPMRRYATDPEVGVPQLGPGLGASMETPVTDGIFNQGPAAGFTRGVFTPDPPYATPRYIAAVPDGVAGMGAFGQTPTCGIDVLVNKIIAQLPSIGFSLPDELAWVAKLAGQPTSFTIKPDPQLIKSIVYSLVGTAGEQLASLAQKGATVIADLMAAKLADPIVKQIMLAPDIPKAAKDAGASIVKNFVTKTLRSKLLGVSKIIMDCAGVEPEKVPFIQGAAEAAAVMTEDTKSSMMAKLIELQLQQTAQFDPSSFQAKMASITTLASAQAKCFGAGGEWFPYPGAQCEIGPGGVLQNCVPYAGVGKRYTCVPKGTPGAKTQDQATGKSSDQATGKSSNLPLILGAAAVAALLLTRL